MTAEREPGASTRASGERSDDSTELVRHEEELEVGKDVREVGAVRARKTVEARSVTETVPRQTEHFEDVERLPPAEHDSGEVETLPDGSVSIPILEEELVVTKRVVVRERVLIRKRTEIEHERVQAELRKERLEIDADETVDISDESAR